MLLLTGTSGSGKGTLAGRLTADRIGPLRFARPVTATDRPPRPGERDGFDYHFLTTQEFRRMAASGEFYEYHAVYGQLKGVPRFVGRRKELRKLASMLAEARAGHLRFVLLIGAAGIGKTTVAERFAGVAHKSGRPHVDVALH